MTTLAKGCAPPDLGPWPPENRPAQPTLTYRLSSYATFLRRMIARLPDVTVEVDGPDGATQRLTPLAHLTTRDADDPVIALLDAWAVVADVLTFYQERIANEGYLRTATERRSVLELARAIGYELSPGVAAGTHLAFTLDDTEQGPVSVMLEAGLQVKSMPEPGLLPQTYEAVGSLEARPEWNALHPRQTQPQRLQEDVSTRYIKGVDTELKAGDWLLLVREKTVGSGTQAEPLPRRILAVTPEPDLKRTRLDLDLSFRKMTLVAYLPVLHLPAVQWTAAPLNAVILKASVRTKGWRGRDLSAFLKVQGWNTKAVVKHLNVQARVLPPVRKYQAPGKPLPFEPGLYAFRVKTGAFGHNAPRWDSLPLNQRFTSENGNRAVPYAQSWDGANEPAVYQNSQKQSYQTSHPGADVFCERVVGEVVEQGWVLVQQGTGSPVAFQVKSAQEASLADYGISGKVTGLGLQKPDGSGPSLSGFGVRSTSLLVGSRRLELVDLPIEDELGAGTTEVNQVTLDRMVLGLEAGQQVILAGERADLPGVDEAEVLTLKEAFHEEALTTLRFTTALVNRYVRKTVTISANVVAATHGEVVKDEVLGSGEGTRPHQRFKLNKPPLTYVSSANASGAESTLKVEVDGITWAEVESLFGQDADAQVYTVRHEDDGTTRLQFGDGLKGTRLPTGLENVRATYRSGIGPDGEVAAGRLTLLAKRPLGVRSVTNPVAATGSAAPEAMRDARRNAPRTVLTFDRIVSLQDFEDFARTFAGIGRAQAQALWDGQHHLVYLTVADAKGRPLTATSTTYKSLRDAIDRARDPGQPVRIADFDSRFFNLDALIRVDRRHNLEQVRAAVEAALRVAFAFEARAFGQAVTAAEVIQVIQRQTGVVAVDLNKLYLTDDVTGPAQVVPAAVLPGRRARWNGRTVEKTRLLLINPAGIELIGESV